METMLLSWNLMGRVKFGTSGIFWSFSETKKMKISSQSASKTATKPKRKNSTQNSQKEFSPN